MVASGGVSSLADLRARCLRAAHERWNWENESAKLLALYRDLTAHAGAAARRDDTAAERLREPPRFRASVRTGDDGAARYDYQARDVYLPRNDGGGDRDGDKPEALD